MAFMALSVFIQTFQWNYWFRISDDVLLVICAVWFLRVYRQKRKTIPEADEQQEIHKRQLLGVLAVLIGILVWFCFTSGLIVWH
jgi:hypothetical protein